jgi:hypothetical protein
MTDALFHAYAPLLLWTGLGIVLFRFLPDTLPRLLGRSLYWVGIPIEIFALARQTDFSEQVGLVPLLTIATLLGGLTLAWISLKILRWLSISASAEIEQKTAEEAGQSGWSDRNRQGSFLLASMLGNTGFIGLAIAPIFVDRAGQSWLVFYSVTQNVVGTYGIGVLLASYFGRHIEQHRGWILLGDVLTVPSLWAFAVGSLTRSVPLPEMIDLGLQASIGIVIPIALLLMGMRLSQLQGWKSLRLAVVPAVLKTVVIPLMVGVGMLELGVAPGARLAMVLMAGMPTAFAGLILAEEYDLDRELIASSIVLTSLFLLLTVPLWLLVFGDG